MAKFLDREIVNVDFGSITNQTVQTTLNLKPVVSGTFTQYFTFTFTLKVIGHAKSAEVSKVFAQLASLEYNPFDFPIPQCKFTGKAGTASNTAAGRNSVRTAGSEIEVGRFISFSSHRKVYLVTASTSSTITIYPSLREDVSGAINVNPKLRAMLLDIPTISFLQGTSRPFVQVREIL